MVIASVMFFKVNHQNPTADVTLMFMMQNDDAPLMFMMQNDD